MPISKTASVYLNCVRWCAALAVVLYHYHDKNFGPAAITRFFPSNGHGYVIVFFVVSGFVVAMTAEKKTASEFALDRAIRIGIVALPVLAICGVMSIGAPDLSPEYPEATIAPALTFVLNATFISQCWWLNVPPFADAPYWSLCYEVFYYLIFAAYRYGGKSKWLLALIACAIAGPKIIILLPCWLAGAAAYNLRNIAARSAAGWAAFLVAPVVLVLIIHFGRDQLNAISDHIGFAMTTSGGFIRSWVVAFCFAIHIWGVARVTIPIPETVTATAKQLAEMSYSLYLLHLPALYVATTVLGRTSAEMLWIGLPSTLLACAGFATLTEQRRQFLKAAIGTRFVKV